MTGARLLSAVAALLAITSVAAAQSDSGDPLAEIRNRASFTAAEDQVIDQWISDRLAELKGADPDRRWRAAREFREAFQNEVNNSQSSPRYLRRLAERFTPVATQEFRNPDQNKDEAVQVAVA